MYLLHILGCPLSPTYPLFCDTEFWYILNTNCHSYKSWKMVPETFSVKPKNKATQILFSLQAKGPALWKSGAITCHYSNKETLVTPSLWLLRVEMGSLWSMFSKKLLQVCTGQAGVGACSASLAGNRK